MSYADTLKRLAADSERQALAVYRLFVEDRLDRDDTINLIATMIARANGRARMLADYAIAVDLMIQLQEVVPVTGVDVPDDFEANKSGVDGPGDC